MKIEKSLSCCESTLTTRFYFVLSYFSVSSDVGLQHHARSSLFRSLATLQAVPGGAMHPTSVLWPVGPRKVGSGLGQTVTAQMKAVTCAGEPDKNTLSPILPPFPRLPILSVSIKPKSFSAEWKCPSRAPGGGPSPLPGASGTSERSCPARQTEGPEEPSAFSWSRPRFCVRPAQRCSAGWWWSGPIGPQPVFGFS